jgi:maltooligosyltrehalose trehalohydrolase
MEQTAMTTQPRAFARATAFGAEPCPGGSHVRVHAASRRCVDVVVEADGRVVGLAAEGDGWFSGVVAGLGAGACYRLRLDGDVVIPDPASRCQPQGPHGPSRVVDHSRFAWTDALWPGVTLPGAVLYELHVGTFTPEGTFEAAARLLGDLADLGVTVVEIMPVAEFAGDFGWGYDGVDLFAPSHLYGTPDDLRRFVDRAHDVGIGVVLDVVYNHFGPDGNYTAQLSDCWVSKRYPNEWGEALNFDADGCEVVREFILENARMWIRDYHLDGLRLDATQQIYDASADHIVAAIVRAARAAAGYRSVLLIAENETQSARLCHADVDGGFGCDAIWNDDLHHSAFVALTGRAEAYFSDHCGRPQEFISAAKRGFLFQGQRYAWQKQRRGTPTTGLAPRTFVACLENHDQVANAAAGRRITRLTSPAKKRAMTTLFLLGPWTPMLFMGEEHDAAAPFTYFASHPPELAGLVKQGRSDFLAQFPSLRASTSRERLLDPAAPSTFARCKLDPADRRRSSGTRQLYTDLLRLRREDATLAAQGEFGFDGAVIGHDAFVFRFFGVDPAGDRLLVVNLGADLDLTHAPEPLLAPPWSQRWTLALSSEDPRYGGDGVAPFVDDEPWTVWGSTALLLVPVEDGPRGSKGAP